MRVASLSDLHLGPSPALDGFRGPESALLRLLDHLEDHHDEVILLGDLVGTDYGPWPGSRVEVLHATLARYRATARRWLEGPYTLLFGNHDPVTQVELGAIEAIELECAGFRARWSHGHQHDPLMLGPIPDLCTWAIGGARRLGAGCAGDFLQGRVYQLGQDLAEPRGATELAACGLLESGSQDVVVMGHTHRAACRPCGPGVYANSGAGRADALRYVSVDMEAREVRLMGFDGIRAVEQQVWGAL